ncbi:hypothetical protein GCM10009628_38260 [Paeniglutamicibacter kerguelensis]
MKANPDAAPWRPEVGLQPLITDAELVIVTVLQALPGYTPERRWLRHARVDLIEWFPHLPGQSGYNKHLRHLGGTLQAVTAHLGRDTGLWADGITGGRLDTGRMRPLPRNGPPLRAGRVRRNRVLRLALPLVPGPAPAPFVHAGRGCRWASP